MQPYTTTKIKDVEELVDKIQQYFNYCDQNKKPYTVPGLAYFLGYKNRRSITDLKNRDEEFESVIERAKLFIEAQRNEQLLHGNKNITGCIFDLKNNFDWVDRQEVTGSDGGPVIQVISAIDRTSEDEDEQGS